MWSPHIGRSARGVLSQAKTCEFKSAACVAPGEKGERTPMPFMRPLIQERSPPAVAMAVKTSTSQKRRSQTQVIQTPPRPASRAGYRSRTQEIIVPPRPASRASASSAYFEGQRIQRFELSRSPSQSSEISVQSSSVRSKKCPHCHIHSWLPHSPNCPKKN